MRTEDVYVPGEKVRCGIIIDDEIPPSIEEVIEFARKMGAAYYMGEIEMFVIKLENLGNNFFKSNYWAILDKINTAYSLGG